MRNRPDKGGPGLAVGQAFQPDKQVRLESLTYGELVPPTPLPEGKVVILDQVLTGP